MVLFSEEALLDYGQANDSIAQEEASVAASGFEAELEKVPKVE